MRYDPTSKLGYTEIELLMMPFVDTDTSVLEPDWERLDAVGQALSMLTEEEQWVIYRMFYDRVTYEELKNNLGIKAKSHAWRKTRLALESLKNELLKNPLFQEMKDDNHQPNETKSPTRGVEAGSDNDGTTEG
jgi:hypothetical protein